MRTFIKTIIFTGALICIITACSKQVNLTPAVNIDCTQQSNQQVHPQDQQFQGILDKYVARGLPGLSAVVLKPGESTWLGAAGLADIDQQIAMSPCHQGFSGSVAKMYTVTAAMILAEQGKLNLDAHISEYLPASISSNLPNGEFATVKQLMNHKAGMPDHDDDPDLNKYIDKNNGQLPSAEDQLAYLYDEEARFVPGDSADYSSAHTVALALIIDNVTNAHHADIISQDIIQPLSLTDTYYKNEMGYPSPSNLVSGYYGTANENDNITQESINYCLGSQGDAGLIATASDYARFLQGVMEAKIIRKRTLTEMTEIELLYDDGVHGFGFGLGVLIVHKDGKLAKVGHSGETFGGMSHVYYYPEADTYLAIITNTIIEDDDGLLRDWTGAVFIDTGFNSIVDEFEYLILK